MKVQEGAISHKINEIVTHSCDGCREKIAQNEGEDKNHYLETFRRCDKCDYDLCAKCVKI